MQELKKQQLGVMSDLKKQFDLSTIEVTNTPLEHNTNYFVNESSSFLNISIKPPKKGNTESKKAGEAVEAAHEVTDSQIRVKRRASAFASVPKKNTTNRSTSQNSDINDLKFEFADEPKQQCGEYGQSTTTAIEEASNMPLQKELLFKNELFNNCSSALANQNMNNIQVRNQTAQHSGYFGATNGE